MQLKQKEWYEQWEMLKDNELFLFQDWIAPNRLEDFRGKEILECGCGGGQHTAMMAAYAKQVTAVDLNTTEIAKKANAQHRNVEFLEADIASMDLGRQFDIVISIGVVHHTDDPDKTVQNLVRHVKPGGKLIIWVYAREGNFLMRTAVEPVRKIFLKKISRKSLLGISNIVTTALYPVVHTVYRLPCAFLPYYEYFENFRKMSFERNALNVFDKLNAPQTEFISRQRIQNWFQGDAFENVHISHYKKVSWRGSGVKKRTVNG